ncbi:MAG TPA: 3-isopropylmalate dehydrogenase [Vitreimonas sp.]|nr:3-isopropylmalate dehydrogenase [Vitreimonas sp.]
MTKTHKIALLPGDGVGPEVIAVARDVLDAVSAQTGARFSYSAHLIGGAAIDASGDPLPQTTLAGCLESDGVLLGAVGGPKWDRASVRPEAGLLAVRKALGLFANIRPLRVEAALAEHSPLKTEIVEDVDLVIVRELTGGAYYGDKRRFSDSASDLCIYSTGEIERVARVAFELARARYGKVTSVDKANVMETSRLWRETVTRMHVESYADVKLEHVLVDAMAMHLVKRPRDFDVVLTENMFGDILSDEASMLAGSIGLAPSASLGVSKPGLFEPIHGSAPDIAGRDLANPVGTVLSAAMMLRYTLGLTKEADAVEAAVSDAINRGARTADLGGSFGCREMGDAIIKELHAAALPPGHRMPMHWG